jgi:Arm domain-containing DNA-binding protein
MPRPRRDGTPARSTPNRRRLSDAFAKTVRGDPERVIVYWDTLQRGLALAVQRSGHRAWKCIYSIRGRGARWYHLGNAGAITLADARRLASKCIRSPRAKIHTRIGSRYVVGDRSSRWLSDML